MKGRTTVRTRLLILVVAFVCVAFVLLFIVGLLQSNLASAAGPTHVSGGIFQDTTWSANQSPYIVTDTVVLFPGYTLTVEPGVEMRFYSSTALIIRGTLIAEGTQSNPIVFTSNDSLPTKGSWIGLTIANNQGGNASVKFANISYAQTGLMVYGGDLGWPVNISDSVYSNNEIALWEGGMQVDRCTFENNTYAVKRGHYRISDSLFINNVYGLMGTGGSSVYTSTFISNQVGIWSGSGEVKYSLFFGNGIGVNFEWAGFNLYYNTIINNTVGVKLNRSLAGVGKAIENNNIYNNTEHNMRNNSETNRDASNNWWGTTDTSVIDEGIYDGRDDALLGLVNYQPFLQERVDDGWSTQYLPLVTKQP